MPAAVIDSFISINSLPIITISAAADACEDDGDVVISSNVFVCIKKERKKAFYLHFEIIFAHEHSLDKPLLRFNRKTKIQQFDLSMWSMFVSSKHKI